MQNLLPPSVPDCSESPETHVSIQDILKLALRTHTPSLASDDSFDSDSQFYPSKFFLDTLEHTAYYSDSVECESDSESASKRPCKIRSFNLRDPRSALLAAAVACRSPTKSEWWGGGDYDPFPCFSSTYHGSINLIPKVYVNQHKKKTPSGKRVTFCETREEFSHADWMNRMDKLHCLDEIVETLVNNTQPMEHSVSPPAQKEKKSWCNWIHQMFSMYDDDGNSRTLNFGHLNGDLEYGAYRFDL